MDGWISALEALRNALYKFKTYLLTYYGWMVFLPRDAMLKALIGIYQ